MNIFQGNWVDLIILAVLAYIVADSWKTGFWIIMADFVGFLLSLFVALRWYSLIGNILEESFTLPHSVANALGFFFAAGISEAVLGFVLVHVIRKIPYKFWKKPWNNIAGVIPSLGQGLILVSFILTLVVSLPIAPNIKKDVTESKIGGFLVQKTSGVEAKLTEVF